MNLLIALLMAGPVQPTSASVEAANAQFLKLTVDANRALQSKDMAALDRLLAKDFAYSMFVAGRMPSVMSRSETLDMAERHYTLEHFEIRDLAARILGQVAVVRYQPYREAMAGTVERRGEFAIVDVWVRDGSDWRLSMRYQSRPDPGMTPR
jgi:hypothetical protein